MNPGCAATLRAFQTAYRDYFFPDSVVATVVSLILFAGILAVLIAPLVLRGYASQVRRLMQMRQVAELPAAWYARRRQSFPALPPDAAPGPVSFEDLQQAGAARHAAIGRATLAAYAAFVLPAPALLWTAPAPPIADIVGFCLAVPMLAAVPALVNIRPQGSKTLVLAGMIVLGVVLGVIDPAGDQDPFVPVEVTVFLGVLYLVTAHRKLRTVVILMTIWLTAILCGGVAAVWLASPTWLCLDDSPGWREWATAGTGLTFAALLFTGFVYGGRWAMGTLSRFAQRGLLSDISLAAAAGLGFIALMLAFAISMEGPFPKWQIAVMAVLWLGVSFGCYAWVLSRGVRPVAQRSLLVLRVFSKRRAAERLLDAVQARWRYLGPVYEIAGPDLARLNLDVHEFQKYISSGLHEVFLLSTGDRREVVLSLDHRADREGRFRVNEVFCLESSWRATVEDLMRTSDAIVLDLRGFNRDSRGAGFELELLARCGLLPRVLLLGDPTTDWENVDHRLRRAGCNPETVARSHVAPKETAEGVVAALMRAAIGERALTNAAL